MYRVIISKPGACVRAVRSVRTALSSQTSCQTRNPGREAFTLLELLVVIVIIGILGSALVVSVQSGYKQARQANCKSNLRQFGVALTIYRGEHDNKTPDWLSNLYPEYVDDRSMYVCRADKNAGRDTPRPTDLVALISGRNVTDTPSYWDNEKNSDSSRTKAIESCSYLYEFSNARTTWRVPDHPGTPEYRMRDYKMDQMTYGDDSSKVNGEKMPYSASRIPLARCYHHFKDQKILGYGDSNAKTAKRASRQFITVNVAYAGNVFVGPTWWEGTIHPGESQQ